MMRYFLLFIFALFGLSSMAQDVSKGVSAPSHVPCDKCSWLYINTANGTLYAWDASSSWVQISGGGHDAVTLAGSLDYLTLSSQEITRNAIDLTTDVTGSANGLPATNPWGGTGTIAAALDSAFANSGGGGSWNHIATQNIELGTYYLTNDGDNEGIGIETDGESRFYQNGATMMRVGYDATNDHASVVVGKGQTATAQYAMTVKPLLDYTSGSTGALSISPTFTPSSTSTGGLVGVNLNSVSSGSFSGSYHNGINLNANHTGSAALATLKGASYSATNGGSNTVTNAYAAEFIINESGTGSISNGYGIYVPAANGTIGTFYGMRVLNSSSPTTVYGMRLGISDRAGTIYNLYADGTADNYMAGNLGLGVTSPSIQLDVNGDARFRAEVRDGDGDFGNAGDYFGSDGTDGDWIDPSVEISDSLAWFGTHQITNDTLTINFQSKRQMNVDWDLNSVVSLTVSSMSGGMDGATYTIHLFEVNGSNTTITWPANVYLEDNTAAGAEEYTQGQIIPVLYNSARNRYYIPAAR